jgi:HK97 family phage portal protein
VGPQLVGLSFLDPNKLVCNRDQNGRKRWQYPRENGEMREIPESRIWTIPGFTLDGTNGVSVISYGAKVFGSAIAADKAAAQTFKNGLLQTIYYKMANFLKPEQRVEFKKNLAGSIERGEAPLLEGGTDAGTLGIKPSDAQLLESRGFSVEAICRWFRVPPWMVGHTEKSSSWGTGIEQQMIGFLTFTLGPWLRRIEQAISKDLLTPAERTRFLSEVRRRRPAACGQRRPRLVLRRHGEQRHPDPRRGARARRPGADGRQCCGVDCAVRNDHARRARHGERRKPSAGFDPRIPRHRRRTLEGLNP